MAYNWNSNEIIVSFRGSANIQNWITDLNFGMMKYPGSNTNAQVHSGFF